MTHIVSKNNNFYVLCSVLIHMFQEAVGQAQMSEPGYWGASIGHSTWQVKTESNAFYVEPFISF